MSFNNIGNTLNFGGCQRQEPMGRETKQNTDRTSSSNTMLIERRPQTQTMYAVQEATKPLWEIYLELNTQFNDAKNRIARVSDLKEQNALFSKTKASLYRLVKNLKQMYGEIFHIDQSSKVQQNSSQTVVMVREAYKNAKADLDFINNAIVNSRASSALRQPPASLEARAYPSNLGGGISVERRSSSVVSNGQEIFERLQQQSEVAVRLHENILEIVVNYAYSIRHNRSLLLNYTNFHAHWVNQAKNQRQALNHIIESARGREKTVDLSVNHRLQMALYNYNDILIKWRKEICNSESKNR